MNKAALWEVSHPPTLLGGYAFRRSRPFPPVSHPPCPSRTLHTRLQPWTTSTLHNMEITENFRFSTLAPQTEVAKMWHKNIVGVAVSECGSDATPGRIRESLDTYHSMACEFWYRQGNGPNVWVEVYYEMVEHMAWLKVCTQ